MASKNKETIMAYDAAAQAFVERDTGRSREGFYSRWLEEAFAKLPQAAKILEVGSAHGRDAQRLKLSGYDVQISDVTPAFLTILKDLGLNPITLDIVNTAPAIKYDAILASAVFLHFTTEDFNKALQNVAKGLRPGGRLIFSLIEGEGDAYSRSYTLPRYFRYWQLEELKTVLEENGFESIDVRKTKFEQQTWLYLVARQLER